MNSPRRILLTGSLGALAAVLAAASLAWACTGPTVSVALSPEAGVPGTEVTATVDGFQPVPVELRWGSSTGPMLGTGDGRQFTFKVPSGAPDTYMVVAQTVQYEGPPVNAVAPFMVKAPPIASFTTTPSSARPGQSVRFEGSASTDPDGTVVRYEWDLDGDGSYETDTGRTPSASQVYSTAGQRTVRLRVTDDEGYTGARALALRVIAPAVSFVAPASALVPTLIVSSPGSKKVITVGKGGRFRYSLAAEPGVTGKILLRSIKKIGGRRISLETKRFRAPASGIVKVSWKLSRRNRQILNRIGSIGFRATVRLGGPGDAPRSRVTTLTLKKPTR